MENKPDVLKRLALGGLDSIFATYLLSFLMNVIKLTQNYYKNDFVEICVMI
jgi:hypothetical protein